MRTMTRVGDARKDPYGKTASCVRKNNIFVPRIKHEDRTRTRLYLAIEHNSPKPRSGGEDMAGTCAYLRGEMNAYIDERE